MKAGITETRNNPIYADTLYCYFCFICICLANVGFS